MGYCNASMLSSGLCILLFSQRNILYLILSVCMRAECMQNCNIIGICIAIVMSASQRDTLIIVSCIILIANARAAWQHALFIRH